MISVPGGALTTQPRRTSSASQLASGRAAVLSIEAPRPVHGLPQLGTASTPSAPDRGPQHVGADELAAGSRALVDGRGARERACGAVPRARARDRHAEDARRVGAVPSWPELLAEGRAARAARAPVVRRRRRRRRAGRSGWPRPPRRRSALAVLLTCGVAASGPNSRAVAARWRRRRSLALSSRAGALALRLGGRGRRAVGVGVAVCGGDGGRWSPAAWRLLVAPRAGAACVRALRAARRCVSRSAWARTRARAGRRTRPRASTPAQPTATLVPSPTLSAVPAPTAVPLASAASCASRAAAPPPRPTSGAEAGGEPLPRADQRHADHLQQPARPQRERAAVQAVEQVRVDAGRVVAREPRPGCAAAAARDRTAGPDSALVSASQPALARARRAGARTGCG